MIPDKVVAGLAVTVDVTERRQAAQALPAMLITGDPDPLLITGMSQRGILILHKPAGIETLQEAIAAVRSRDAKTLLLNHRKGSAL